MLVAVEVVVEVEVDVELVMVVIDDVVVGTIMVTVGVEAVDVDLVTPAQEHAEANRDDAEALGVQADWAYAGT